MSWAIAMIRAGEELAFAGYLRGAGMMSYLPTYQRKIRIRGKQTKRTVAAWPGYIMIREPEPIDDARFFYYLQIDDEMARFTDDQVDAYRLMERLGVFRVRDESLGIGESVKVASGLLRGLRGHVDQSLRGKDVRVYGGDFLKPMWVPAALLSPDLQVE